MADEDVATVVKVLATIAIGVLVLGPIFAMGINLSGSTVAIHPADDPDPELASGNIPNWVRVESTTGRTAAYTSDSGHTSFSAPLNTSQSYTATVVTKFDSDADTNATYTLLGHNYGEFALHYDNGSYRAVVENDNQSAAASLPAPDPTNPTLVGVHYNASTDSMQVIRATNRSTPTALTNETAQRPVSFTVDGWLDELRLLQGNLSESQLARNANTPSASLHTTNRVARIMWDIESSSPTVYFTDTTASISGATWTTGVSDPGLVRGQDYDLSSDPFTVHVLDGGLIEDAPVAFVSWNGPFGTFIQSIQGLARTALTLLAVATIAIGGRRALSAF